MTGLATSRKHASTRCVKIAGRLVIEVESGSILPGTIPCPRPSPLIRSIPAPMSAARLSRPRRASRHLSRSMKSDTEAPEHGDCSKSQTLVRDEDVCEASHSAASVLNEPIELY